MTAPFVNVALGSLCKAPPSGTGGLCAFLLGGAITGGRRQDALGWGVAAHWRLKARCAMGQPVGYVVNLNGRR